MRRPWRGVSSGSGEFRAGQRVMFYPTSVRAESTPGESRSTKNRADHDGLLAILVAAHRSTHDGSHAHRALGRFAMPATPMFDALSLRHEHSVADTTWISFWHDYALTRYMRRLESSNTFNGWSINSRSCIEDAFRVGSISSDRWQLVLSVWLPEWQPPAPSSAIQPPTCNPPALGLLGYDQGSCLRLL